MSLRELYQEMIVDHGRNPRNFKKLHLANHIKEGRNPLCGDELTVYMQLTNNIIEDVTFKGDGCAISMASASLMTEVLKGKSVEEAELIFSRFHNLVTSGNGEDTILGKLTIFGGVAEFPARVKCASLAWHTMIAALHNDLSLVTTE